MSDVIIQTICIDKEGVFWYNPVKPSSELIPKDILMGVKKSFNLKEMPHSVFFSEEDILISEFWEN